MPKRPPRRPTFLGQALLILLPVLALVVMGSLSLRQDRLLAEQQARAKAQDLAEDLAARLWNTLTNLAPTATPTPSSPSTATPAPPAGLHLVFSTTGQLLHPPPIADLAPHAPNLKSLDETQSQLRRSAQIGEWLDRDLAEACALWEQFLATSPAPELAAAANLSLGTLQARLQRGPQAFASLSRAITNTVDAPLESGLPVTVAAALQWFMTAEGLDHAAMPSPPAWIDPVCSNAVTRPTLLSAPLLQAAVAFEDRAGGMSARGFHLQWTAHDQARALFPTLRRLLLPFSSAASPTSLTRADPTSQLAWLHFEQPWLAVLSPADADTFRVSCLPQSALREILGTLLASTAHRSPGFSAAVSLAGERLGAGSWSQIDLRPTPARNNAPRPTAFAPRASRPSRASSARNNLPHPPAFAPPGPRHRANHLAPPRDPDPTTPPPEVWATARRGADPRHALQVDLLLVDRAGLFAQQRARTLWFAGLIAAAAAAAMAGLLSAGRAFNRQLRLSAFKSNFVSSVSHELRAPIASVRLLAESLDRGKVPEPERQAEYFRLIVQECRRLSSLIDNVLDFSRIDQGRKSYELVPTDVVALVQQTVQLMTPYAAERQVRLETQREVAGPGLQESSPHLDGRAIQQALVNLLDNAIKHAPANTTVVVGLEVDRHAGQSVQSGHSSLVIRHSSLAPSASSDTTAPPPTLLLWVEDQGPGIPPEEQARIFELFYRRGSELRRDTQGIGIGLTIVQHIAQAHRGRVTVHSHPGQGTRFTLEVPYAQ